jgi:hypothetical protein
MWQQRADCIKAAFTQSWAVARPIVQRTAVASLAFARGPLKVVVKALIQTLAALVVLFFEWGWQPLASLLGHVAQYFGFRRITAWILSLPPYGALALFAAPAVCLIPVKLFAVYLFASGHPVLGVSLLILAKVVGTAIVARIYILTQPKLMTIGWFKLAHDRFMPWKDRMFAEIRASAAWRTGRIIRVEVKRTVNRTWIALKPQRMWIAQTASVIRSQLATLVSRFAKGMR